MFKWIFTLVLFPFFAFSASKEEVKEQCAQQIISAFEMQSRGLTTQAFYAWKKAYTTLKENGVSSYTLDPLLELFIWYRTYGHSCGVTFKPSCCTDEHKSNRSLFKTVDYKDFDADQKRMVRDFLCGVGCMVSGVLCITVNTPIGGKFGVTLIATGGKYMWDAVNAMMRDYEEKKERLIELNQITNKATATVGNKK